MVNLIRSARIILALAFQCAAVRAANTAHDVSSRGGFFSQCENSFVGLDNGVLIMSGFCPHCSYFWVGRCFANVDGALVPANGDGGFGDTCEDCTNADWARPSWMTCNCWTTGEDGEAKRVLAGIDLDQHIYFRNGVLGCSGEEGRRCGT